MYVYKFLEKSNKLHQPTSNCILILPPVQTQDMCQGSVLRQQDNYLKLPCILTMWNKRQLMKYLSKPLPLPRPSSRICSVDDPIWRRANSESSNSSEVTKRRGREFKSREEKYCGQHHTWSDTVGIIGQWNRGLDDSGLLGRDIGSQGECIPPCRRDVLPLFWRDRKNK